MATSALGEPVDEVGGVFTGGGLGRHVRHLVRVPGRNAPLVTGPGGYLTRYLVGAVLVLIEGALVTRITSVR